MVPTFQDRDYLVTEKISTLFKNYDKGDIVIVDTHDKFIIKRLIGEPGDTIEFVPAHYEENKTSYVKVNGIALKEDYIQDEMRIDEYSKLIVEDNHYFVMGDNRNNSADSRFYGTFEETDIEGVVFLEINNNLRFY